MMQLNRTVRSLIYGFTLTGFMLALGNALADDTSLRIQDLMGGELTKERLFSAILTGAWQAGKPEACNELAKVLSKPGDYSAYDIECNLGNVVDVQAVESFADGFLLKATLSRSHIKANFTQPFLGKFADSSVDIRWDSIFNIKVKYTDDGVCTGWPGKLPWLRFESASFEALSPDVDVHSTVADILGGITGFFSGFLFGGSGSIPFAIAGAFGTSAIIEGVAREQVPQGKINFTDQANKELTKDFSPCELVNTFGGLAGKFQTRSLTSNLVILAATGESLILSPIYYLLGM